MATSHGQQDQPTYLSVCDFYLSGHLKSVVYSAPSPCTTQQLKLRIQEEISRIPVDVLRRAMSSVQDRLAECEQHNGGHLEDVIFRVGWCVFYVLCYVSRPLIHLFLQMLKYVVSPKRNWTFEIARQWAGAGCLQWWCCVAGTLKFIFTLATSRHFN